MVWGFDEIDTKFQEIRENIKESYEDDSPSLLQTLLICGFLVWAIDWLVSR